MSDFFHSGWSIFVAAATVVSLLACLALLFVASQRKVMADDNTTGHVWDGDLRELNNPLPRWWMWLFVLTVRLRRRLPGAVSRAWAAIAGELELDAASASTRPSSAAGAGRAWRRCTPSSRR